MQKVTEKTAREAEVVEQLKVRRVVRPPEAHVDTPTSDYGPEHVTIPAPESEVEADLRRARLLANWLDNKFNIAGIRFGLDSLVGLIPVAGDVLSFLAGLYPLHLAAKHDLGTIVKTRMAGNLLIDFGVGAIPLVGDVFDIGYKANVKNLKLLEEALEKKRRLAASTSRG